MLPSAFLCPTLVNLLFAPHIPRSQAFDRVMAPTYDSQDYYAVLEVSSNASFEEIRTSYRRLIAIHHPDKNGGLPSATARSQLVSSSTQLWHGLYPS